MQLRFLFAYWSSCVSSTDEFFMWFPIAVTMRSLIADLLCSFLFYIYICGPFLKIALDSAFGPSPMPIPINRMSNEIEKHQECSRTPHHYLWNNIWLWPEVQVFAERSERLCHCSGQLPSFLNDIFSKYRILVWQLFLLRHFQKVILFSFVF